MCTICVKKNPIYFKFIHSRQCVNGKAKKKERRRRTKEAKEEEEDERTLVAALLGLGSGRGGMLEITFDVFQQLHRGTEPSRRLAHGRANNRLGALSRR